MIAVDTSVLVAIFQDEPESAGFQEAIVDDGAALLSSMSYLETSIVLSGRQNDGRVFALIDRLLQRLSIDVAPFDASQAQAARDAFLRYGKGRHPAALNFGDCASYALAACRDAYLQRR